MSLSAEDRDFIRRTVAREVAGAVSQLGGIMPRGIIYTGFCAISGFVLAGMALDVKNKNIPHISYPAGELERLLVDAAGIFSVWTGGFLADYNRMYPGQSVGQMIIGLTNAQTTDFAAAMRKRESSNQYGIIHEFGYLGAYGMGAGALADVGLINIEKYRAAPKAVKNGSHRKTHLSFLKNNNNWNRYSFEQFLNNAGVQDQAFLDLANLNIRRGFKGGVLKRGDHKRLAGFAAAAHLVGATGALKHYGWGTKLDAVTDRYGTTAGEYAALGEASIKGAPPKDIGAKPAGLPMDDRYYSRVSSGFGYRFLGGRKQHHSGIDFAVPVGTPVKATADGKVVFAGDYKGACGYGVKVQHRNGYATVFCHLSAVKAARFEWVRKGAIIGLSGGKKGAAGSGSSTGPHIHYSVKLDGKAIDPMVTLPRIAAGNKFNKFAVRPQQLPLPSGGTRHTNTSARTGAQAHTTRTHGSQQ